MSPRLRATLILISLLAGLLLACTSARSDIGSLPQLIIMASALLLGLTPPISRRINNLAARIRSVRPRNYSKFALIIALAAIIYLLIAAGTGGRDFLPKWHDEQAELLQTRMMAHGRLWMPQHPLADFFESSYLLVKPVYAGIYFPGTALLYAPSIWFALPTSVAPLLASAAAVAFLWLIIAEQIDAFAATLAALLLLSIEKFRFLSIMYMSHIPMLLLGLLSVWAWLRWRRNQHAKWAILIGVFTGWAAITRPVDAVAYAVPIAAALLLDLLSIARKASIPKTALCIIAGAIPFLALQITQNYGTTGHFFKTPYTQYLDANSPEVAYGTAQTTQPTQTRLLQKLVFDREFNQPIIRADSPKQKISRWFNWKLPIIARATTPTPWLLLLWPAGLVFATNRRWILPAMFIAFVVLYTPFAFMLGHYPVVASPGVIAAILFAACFVPAAFPHHQAPLFSTFTLFIIASALYPMLASLPPPGDDPQLFNTVAYANHQLPQQVKIPAVVLVRFHEYNSPHQEIVYNTDVLNPDDAPIIKAQDLGPDRDGEIIRYYARTQPNRNFYLLDRGLPNLKPQPLGTAIQLAAKLPQLPDSLAHPAEIPPSQTWKTKLRND